MTRRQEINVRLQEIWRPNPSISLTMHAVNKTRKTIVKQSIFSNQVLSLKYSGEINAELEPKRNSDWQLLLESSQVQWGRLRQGRSVRDGRSEKVTWQKLAIFSATNYASEKSSENCGMTHFRINTKIEQQLDTAGSSSLLSCYNRIYYLEMFN